ncbi:putative trimeric autoransporter, BpaB [Caballeronia terrestris]|uniref:Trimeric autoransporter, BpaB n=1 Tax=Caballeronia terrestris TaxID=1226301 RepID=A0A158FEX7_9BURK|nr:YadA C-terminal domain-containing protein [Caballeronia terrestris]SAL18241.1 putative trimeric autoransporter, BpaB [Caballeronia terrestris]
MLERRGSQVVRRYRSGNRADDDPDVDANKTLSIGIGGGTYKGYAATAIGGTTRITQNIKVRVGAGWSSNGTTVGAGAAYQW